MQSINRVRLFPNDQEKSILVAEELTKKLKQYGYTISDDNFDLAIAIGGDGSFLKMVKECEFSDIINYVGINTGTLGFAQEIYPEKIDDFLKNLFISRYEINEIGIQETKVYTYDNVVHYNSLNEISIREANLNTAHLDIIVDEEVLENYVGDGILVSTSFGSTAYNLSFGGSIVYNELHTLQITPIAPLNNKNYRTLTNSIIIPETRKIIIIPKERSKQLLLTIDGENTRYDNISHIETTMNKKRIKCMKMKNYDYTRKINEKFLQD